MRLSRRSRNRSMLHAMLHPKRARFLRRLKHLFIVSPGLTDLLLPADVPEFMKLLVACSNTLEHLAFELGKEPLPLPALPALRVLELWTYVASTDTPEMLHVIIAGMIASVPHLEVLKIAFLDPFGLSQGRPPRHHWMGHRPWAWADLDSTLVNMPHLRDVHVSLRYVWLPEPERYAAFVPFMQSHLPRAFDGGLISFSYGSNALHPMDSFALKD
ncbi:hypothetical protein B0H11DRAFT_2058569 [Mycena galericulata]|nr:hypothetical protein B0H11DRAFT_2058569 [Mycena galericulata]